MKQQNEGHCIDESIMKPKYIDYLLNPGKYSEKDKKDIEYWAEFKKKTNAEESRLKENT